MHKVFLLVFVCKCVMADNIGSNERYIDLLPEEEKQEFLNRIARRILEGIKSNVTPDESHADITDDQLDAHDAFVQEIIREESDSLKNERKFQKEIEDINKNDRNSDNINENIDDKLQSSIMNKEEYIDLTRLEGRRHKRKNGANEFEEETTSEMPYDVIPVKMVYDEFQNKDVKTTDAPGLTLETEQKGNAPSYGKVTMREERNSNDETDKLEKSKNSRLFRSTEILDSKPNSHENPKVAQDIYDEEASPLPTTVLEDLSNRTATEEVAENKMEEINGDTSKLYHNNVDNETLSIEPTSSSDFTDRIINVENRSTVEVTNITLQTSRENSFQNISEILIINGNGNKQTGNSISETLLSENKSTNAGQIENVSISTTEISSHGISFLEVSNKSKINDENIEKLGITRGYSGNVLTAMTSVILPELTTSKTGTRRLNKKEILDLNENLLRTRHNKVVIEIDENESTDENLNHKVYEVYEVDPRQQHFVSAKEKKQSNHPLYVPVYNYAPKNAYFKPYNMLGPNMEDFENQNGPQSKIVHDTHHYNILNTRNRFSGYSGNKKREKLQKNIRQNKESYKKKHKVNLFDFMKPVTQNLFNQDIYYNPFDYADADYSFGRILRRKNKTYKKYYRDRNLKSKKYFPDSNEKDHPVNSIQGSDTIKDHVRAIRNILYLQNIFGYVPSASETSNRKANRYFQIERTFNKTKNNNIAMDYYFGRADSNEEHTSYQDVRLNKPKSKFKNSDYEPLTPNPLSVKIISANKPNKQHFEISSSEFQHTLLSDSESQEIRDIPFKKMFETILLVLRDSIKHENEKLLEYDWLKTTVNIQAGIRKLMELTIHLKSGKPIHPKDIELLKYILYLFKSSKLILEEESKISELIKIQSYDPERAKKIIVKFPNKGTIKDPIKLWKEYAALLLRDERKMNLRSQKDKKLTLLNDFEDFLQRLLLSLNDLHITVKRISLRSDYKNQSWFPDLKDMYLEKGNKKHLGKVILHLGLSRFLDSIEDSSPHVEWDFRSFIKKNSETVDKSKGECLFVLNVLEEISRIKEIKPEE